jgi:tetratricopeptide (TPR) repeat protein
LLILLAPSGAGPEGVVRDDPLEQVMRALEQGRHWYATRLLRNLDGRDRRSPEASLLAARAEAGRGAWEAVERRLQGVAWLDSIGYGEGRALVARAWLETGEYERAAESYRILLSYSIERVPRALAEIGLARALENLGQAAEAAAAWARAAEYAPELEPWSAIRAAEALAPHGDTAAVRRLLDLASDVPLYRRTLASATAHHVAGDRQAALQILLDAAIAPDVGNGAADLRTRAARLQLEEADTAGARQTLRAAVRLTPRSALAAAELLSQLPGLDADDHLRLAESFEKSGAPSRAAQEHQLYLQSVTIAKS